MGTAKAAQAPGTLGALEAGREGREGKGVGQPLKWGPEGQVEQPSRSRVHVQLSALGRCRLAVP